MSSTPVSPRITVGAVQTPAGGITAPEVTRLGDQVTAHDLIVFPEMANTPYFPLAGVPREHLPAAGSLPRDEVLEPYRRLAATAKTHVVAGLCFTHDGGFQNAAVVLDRNGDLVEGIGLNTAEPADIYHKTHLCGVRGYGSAFIEDEHFTPGRELMTWDLDIGRIGVLICYDRHFPGAWSALAAHGVDLVAVPTASPIGTRPTFAAEMQAMALQQSVGIAIANRQGREHLGESDVTYLGSSQVVAANGTQVDLVDVPSTGIATGELDLEAGRETAAAMGMRASQRPDLYLCQPTS